MTSSAALPSAAELHDMERQLHDLQKALRRDARQRAHLVSCMSALARCPSVAATATEDATETHTGDRADSHHVNTSENGPEPISTTPQSSATEAIRARTRQLQQRAVLTSITLELAQLWTSLVLPWFEATVTPFEEMIQRRLTALCARLDVCARRLAPHHRQYRWRQPQATNTTTTSAVAGHMRGPCAVRWYVSSLCDGSDSVAAAGTPPASIPPFPNASAPLPPVKVDDVQSQLDALTRQFTTGPVVAPSEPAQTVATALARPRSLAHLLRIWYSVLPSSSEQLGDAHIAPSHGEGGDENGATVTAPTPLTVLARRWAASLLYPARAVIAHGEVATDDDDQQVCLEALRWLWYGEGDAALSDSAGHTRHGVAAHTEVALAACCRWWLAQPQPASSEGSRPPPTLPSLNAVHASSAGLLLACEEAATMDTATDPVTLAALHEALTALGACDAYDACSVLLQRLWHAEHARHGERALRERLVDLREAEAHHRRFLQQSEARWQECKAQGATLAHNVGSALQAPAAGSGQQQGHHEQQQRRLEEAASICPLQLLLVGPSWRTS